MISLFPDIDALAGYRVRLSPDRLLRNPETDDGFQIPSLGDVRTNTVAYQDALNAPIPVGVSSTRLYSVPSGIVVEVRLQNLGAADVFLAFGVPATATNFPLTPGQLAEFRIAGPRDINAIAASGSQNVQVWVSQLV